MKKLSIIGLLASLSLSPLAAAPGNGSGDTILKNAVQFSGTDFFGNSCGLSLSLMEENGEHVFLTKMDYSLHGESLPDIESGLYRFDISTNTYSDAQSGTGAVSFGGALLADETEADLNQLGAYEASGNLVYSLRVDTGAASAEDYEEALEEVVANPGQLSAYSSTLDQISRVVFKISHDGHYDAGGCVGLKLTAVNAVTFEIGEHDHDDDHDHDHDHDH